MLDRNSVPLVNLSLRRVVHVSERIVLVEDFTKTKYGITGRTNFLRKLFLAHGGGVDWYTTPYFPLRWRNPGHAVRGVVDDTAHETDANLYRAFSSKAKWLLDSKLARSRTLPHKRSLNSNTNYVQVRLISKSLGSSLRQTLPCFTILFPLRCRPRQLKNLLWLLHLSIAQNTRSIA